MEAIVEHNYEPREADELTLKKGDIIKNICVLQGGWWEGTLNDKRGMFPDNFVKVLNTQGSTSINEAESSIEHTKESTISHNSGSGSKWCKVLFSYDPVNVDELQLVREDLIEFLGEVEEGWWRGRLRGQIGVFPSNFVSLSVLEEKQLFKALFPYEAVNEDELTLVEGDIITLVSKDAPDEGWWKGELKGKVGLFPDNFVERINVHNQEDLEQISEKNQIKSLPKASHTRKSNEKAHIRKTFEKNLHTAGNSSESKSLGNKSSVSSLKKLEKNNPNKGNGNASATLGEEFDEVERGEGVKLSHLTASRAKAPRRRPPSTQHLRLYQNINTLLNEDEKLLNGVDDKKSKIHQDEGDSSLCKLRKKAPWVEELKLNQLEKKSLGNDKLDKMETQKLQDISCKRVMNITADEDDASTDAIDQSNLNPQNDDNCKRLESHSSKMFYKDKTPPGFVPYHIFNQLLERVCHLEENQKALKLMIEELLQKSSNTSIYGE